MTTFEKMTDEERKAVYDETYKDIDGLFFQIFIWGQKTLRSLVTSTKIRSC